MTFKTRAAIVAGFLAVGLVACGTPSDTDSTALQDSSVTQATTSAPATTTTEAPTPAATVKKKPKAKVKRTTAPAPKPVVRKAKPKPKKTTTKAQAPARRIVTPGAFCKDAEAGDVGYSRTGHRYVCTYYPSSDRNRWKRA